MATCSGLIAKCHCKRSKERKRQVHRHKRHRLVVVAVCLAQYGTVHAKLGRDRARHDRALTVQYSMGQ
jgi:hypothetical protein